MLGVSRVARRLGSRAPKILLYHGVEDSPLPWNRLSISAKAFDRHLAYLRREFLLVSLSELRSTLDKGERGEGMVALSFDDGLRNNLTVALPLLRRYGVPATWFVATRHCDDGRLLWFNKAKLTFYYLPRAEIEVQGRRYPLSTMADRRRSLSAFFNRASSLPLRELVTLEEALPDPRGFAPDPVYESGFRGLGHQDLSQLRNEPLVEIGAHTCVHPFLSRCTETEAEVEIREGLAHLESAVGRRPRFFAYPADDYDHGTVRVVERLGFEAALSVVSSWRDGDPRFQLQRVGIYDGSLTSLAIKCAA